MAKEIGIAIGGGAAGAILYLATFLDAPAGMVLAYLALLPLFAAGLGLGPRGGFVAAGTATVLVGAASTGLFGIVFALVYALPAAGLTRQALLRRGDANDDDAWYPLGRLLAWLTIYGCGLFAALALAGGESQIAAMTGEIESVMGQVLPTDQNPQVAELMKAVAGYFPAIIIFSWTIMVIANAAIAQSLLARSRHSRRPAPRYAAVELPSWYASATAAVAAAALVTPWMDLGALTFVARNAALAMLVPFFLVGLAVVHVWTRRWPARGVTLTGCYLLLLVFGWPVLLVAGLGFMEQWLLLRRRGAGGTGQEEKR
ncbi:MAG TPA: DUF2232 domain-containing protein [Alphaproteobacteria bacterium]|jgi:hypothetical protein